MPQQLCNKTLLYTTPSKDLRPKMYEIIYTCIHIYIYIYITQNLKEARRKITENRNNSSNKHFYQKKSPQLAIEVVIVQHTSSSNRSLLERLNG